MADTEYSVDITASDDEFEKVIEHVIDRQKQLEERLNANAKALEAYGKSFSKASRRMKNYNKLLEEASKHKDIKLPGIPSCESDKVNNRTRMNNSRVSMERQVGGLNTNRVASQFISNNLNKNVYTKLFSNVALDFKDYIQSIRRINDNNTPPGNNKSQKIAKNNTTKSQIKPEDIANTTKVVSGLKAATLASGLLATALIAFTTAGKLASENTLKLAASITSLGGELDDTYKQSIQSNNQWNYVKNSWGNIVNDIAQLFKPFWDGFVSNAYAITKAISGTSDETVKATNKASKAVLNFAKRVEIAWGINHSQSVSTMSGIAAGYKQSGFSNESAANMSTGIYGTALNLQSKYGGQLEEIVKNITSAIQTGSSSGAQYGLVVDDATLNGWLMLEKGIDGVNVQLSDALKQNYRYELAMYQMANSGSDAMQGQVSEWKKYGNIIDATKNKLYSFDEVINMGAYNFDIPEVGKQQIQLLNPEGSLTDDNGFIATLPFDQATDKVKVLEQNIAKLKEAIAQNAVNMDASQVAQANALVAQLEAQLAQVKQQKDVNINTTALDSAIQLTNQALLELQELSTSVYGVDVDTTGIDNAQLKANNLLNTLQQASNAMGGMGSGIYSTPRNTNFYNASADARRKAAGVEFGTGLGGIWDALKYDVGNLGSAAWKQDTADYIMKGGGGDTFRNLLTTGFVYSMGSAGLNATGLGSKVIGGAKVPAAVPPVTAPSVPSNIVDITLDPRFIAMIQAKASGHANGGLSLSEHIASISEGNKPEVILPLDNPSVEPAYNKIAENLASQMQSGSSDRINVEVAPGGVVIAGEYAISKFTKEIADRLELEQRNRGMLNYGTIGY